jgi:propionyl-CoA carboxylase beta chain
MSHASKSGVAHFVAGSDEDCLEQVRYLLSFLPSNNFESPPYYPPEDDPLRDCPDLDALIPDSPNKPYDMHQVLGSVFDDGEFFEVHSHWARNIICGLARLGGHTVGIVANQPQVLAGTLDITSSTKAARFVRFCDAFNIPLIAFVDVPGFLPGTEQEFTGIIRHGAKLLYAFTEATVPRMTVITRKAYGGAYVVMNSKHIRADASYAWPTAQIAVMGAEGAVNVIHRREIAAADEPDVKRRELITDYEKRFSNPYIAAERGYVDDVIEPGETRRRLVQSLEMLRSKRETIPQRKHGNIPL